jgi:flagellar hook assembly protein FlgD
MKSQILLITVIILTTVAALSAQVTFVQQPAMVSSGANQWTITFEVSQATDVEVSIVDTRDSTVVRHLAAGVLGATPPPPFTANALAQSLTWDGKDDFGTTVPNPQTLSVRVRAGMYPVLSNFAAEHLYDQGGNATSVTDGQGNVYILSNGSGHSPFLRKYDASGNYIKTLFPPPPHLHADSVKSYRLNVLQDGSWVPKSRSVNGIGVQFGYLVMKGATLVNILAGRIRVNTKVSGTHYIDTSGCFTDTLPNLLVKALATGGSEATTVPRLLKAQAPYNEGPFVMERIAVDRANDRVFWNGSNYISDWKNPVVRKLPVSLDNITVGPRGFIYGWNKDGSSGYAYAIIKRYSGTTFAPANYGTGSNWTTGNHYFEYGWAGTPGNHRGIGVSWHDKVASFPEAAPVFEVANTGGNSSSNRMNTTVSGAKALITVPNYTGDGAWSQTRQAFMGIRYDPAGNYYVGIRKFQSPIVPEPVFGMDPAFRNIGSVVKFKKDATGTFNSVNFALTGHEKIYRQPFGPFTKLSSGGWDQLGDMACTCRNSYFDVDPYGRIYVPNGVTCQIYIADNAGNNIAVFGKYGNTDCRGGLSGPGEVKSEPAFPFAWPTSVGASEDFVYVTDVVNARLVQVQMAYILDNIPGLTGGAIDSSQTESSQTNLRLAAYPNPFIPVSHVTFSLPAASNIDLGVYSVSGKLVRRLAGGQYGPGACRFSWDARDDAGNTVSAGVYVFRLRTGNRVLMEKVVLAK